MRSAVGVLDLVLEGIQAIGKLLDISESASQRAVPTVQF